MENILVSQSSAGVFMLKDVFGTSAKSILQPTTTLLVSPDTL